MSRAQRYLEQTYGALMLDELEDYHDIIAGFSGFIEEGKSPGIAYHNRGLAHWEIGEIEKALHDFGEAEIALPNDSMPSQLKGMLLQKLGHLDQALVCLNRSIPISPKDAYVRRTRAHLLVEMGKLKEALHDIDCAIKSEPLLKRSMTRKFRREVLNKIKAQRRIGAEKKWWHLWRK